MRPVVLIALALALGATLWVSAQDDGGVEPVRGGRAPSSVPRRHPDAREANAQASARATPPDAPPGSDRADPLNWAHQALMEGVRQWQGRQSPREGAGSLMAQTSAWSSMQPPPPPPVKRDPLLDEPPPPVAPPFPYQWIGRFSDEAAADDPAPAPGQTAHRAVVSSGAGTWVLKSGDVIEGQWRVDRIETRTMTLTYLPLMLPQTVAMK